MPDEIPYSKLEQIGISKSDVLHFPEPLLSPLMSGRITPLLMAEVKSADGEKLRIPLKLQLSRDTQDQVNVIVYPMRKEILNDLHLTAPEIEKLKKGDVVRKEISEYGKRTQRYFQLDHETLSVIRRDTSALRLNDRIKDVEKLGDIELGREQKKAIHEGKPVELEIGGGKVTVGVDLKEPIGFKNLQGDMALWEQRKAKEYDRLNPGFVGYVKTDENLWEYRQVLLSLQTPQQSESANLKNTPHIGRSHIGR